jgi:hypothetical protein
MVAEGGVTPTADSSGRRFSPALPGFRGTRTAPPPQGAQPVPHRLPVIADTPRGFPCFVAFLVYIPPPIPHPRQARPRSRALRGFAPSPISTAELRRTRVRNEPCPAAFDRADVPRMVAAFGSYPGPCFMDPGRALSAPVRKTGSNCVPCAHLSQTNYQLPPSCARRYF